MSRKKSKMPSLGIACLALAGAFCAANAAYGETLSMVSSPKGKDSNGQVLWASANNWNPAKAPAEGDDLIIDVPVNTYHAISGSFYMKSIRFTTKSLPYHGISYTGPRIKSGGDGLVVEHTTAKTVYGGLYLDGAAIVNLNGDMTFQSGAYGRSASQKGRIIKGGPAMLRLQTCNSDNWTGAEIREGTLQLDKDNGKSGIDFHFAGESSSAHLQLSSNLTLKDGALTSTADLPLTNHGVTDGSAGYTLAITGTPKTNDMYFAGSLEKTASFVFRPSVPAQTFTFARAASYTTGSLTVSNATMRVTDGACFVSLGRLAVEAGGVFAAEGNSGVFANRINVASDGALMPGNGVIITANSISFGGTDVAVGTYTSDGANGSTAASWITGAGVVEVSAAAVPVVEPIVLTVSDGATVTLEEALADYNAAHANEAGFTAVTIESLNGGEGKNRTIVKTGEGTLNMATAVAGYSGSLQVQEGVLACAVADALGANGTMKYVGVYDGAKLVVSADAAVKCLNVDAGGEVEVASGAAIACSTAFYDGSSVGCVILSGEESAGVAADWVSGAGALRVAGNETAAAPTKYRAPAQDGWYELGLASGYMLTEKKGYASETDSAVRPFVMAEKIDWNDWGIPQGAKVRLVGGVLMGTIPAERFSQVNLDGIKQLTPYEPLVFSDGRQFTMPSGSIIRYSPGTWSFHQASNGWYQTAVKATAFKNDINLNGATIVANGNGTHYGNQQYMGALSGTGTIKLDNFSNHLSVYGDFKFSGAVGYNSDAGGTLRIFSPHVEGVLSAVTMISCGSWEEYADYCSTLLLFGPESGKAAADNPLTITQMIGNSASFVRENGTRIRRGGVLVVWGGNKVNIGTVSNGLHVIARVKDQTCQNSGVRDVATFGNGEVSIDSVASGSIFASTNVNLRIGRIANAGSMVDYTYHANAINMTTLDFTNSCAAGASVKATDIAMLPARLSGFTGTVNLSDTADKTYPVQIDLSKGADEVYNKGGCDGSGILGTVPTNGTINVSFTGTETPLDRGEYALARFTSGGEKLANWKVLINGVEATSVSVGSGDTRRVVSVRRDETGLWLKSNKGGMSIVIR